MLYTYNLLRLFIMWLISLVITPFITIWPSYRFGLLDNANTYGIAPRLPECLKYFDTPDNSLEGDNTFKEKNGVGYLQRTRWLYRNCLYGFKWTVLAAPMSLRDLVIEGDNTINYKGPKFGAFRATMGKYWQYKAVKKSIGDRCWIINRGWLLDDTSKQKALFMWSIRWKKVKYDPS